MTLLRARVPEARAIRAFHTQLHPHAHWGRVRFAPGLVSQVQNGNDLDGALYAHASRRFTKLWESLGAADKARFAVKCDQPRAPRGTKEGEVFRASEEASSIIRAGGSCMAAVAVRGS